MKSGEFYLYFLLLVFTCDGLQVHGPPGPLVVQLGESVMLPCFVETPPPMEELEVEWKRNDTETLVHLWQDGESRPESQNQLYRERAHFFTQEIAQGNFSLFLKNMSRKDAVVYKCVVYTQLDKTETLIEIKEIEYLIVSGHQVISASAGEDITLNCFVESHVPPASIEEVSWQKTDEEMLVLLYQEGEILTESTGARYVERAEFFSAEERNKGNFSMRLKNVQIEDKGLYMCLAFSGALSANTTVEVQQLGFSSIHIVVLFLCILGFVIGSLILGYLSYTTYKDNEDSRRAVAIQVAHLLCPNITMSIVFILWGVTEGIWTEAVTCSVLSLVRILFLLWIAPHLKTQDKFRRFINQSAISLQHGVITVVAYYSIYVDVLYKTNTTGKVVLIFYILAAIGGCCISGKLKYNLHISYFSTQFNNMLRTFIIISLYGVNQLYLIVALPPPLLTLIWFSCYFICKRLSVLVWTFVMILLEFVTASCSIYIYYELMNNEEERDALTCVTAFLQILTLMMLFANLNNSPDSESGSRNTGTRGSVSHLGLFMFGTVVVVFVNAATLLVELILKAPEGNGQRTLDLRVIVLPTESVFAVCCLALQINTFWKKNSKRITEELQKLRRCCRCKQTPRDSPPHPDERELEDLNPAARPSGS